MVAAVKGFWSAQPTPVQIAVASGVAVIIAATVLAISLIVRADLRARSGAQAAEYTARAAVAVQFLQATVQSARSSSAQSGHNGSPVSPDGGGPVTRAVNGSATAQPQQNGSQNLLILTTAVATGAQVEVRAPDEWQQVQGIDSTDGRVEVQLPGKSVPMDLVRDIRVGLPSRD